MTHKNHRTDLAVSSRNGQANFAGQQYGDGSSDFNSKTTEKWLKVKVLFVKGYGKLENEYSRR